MCGHAVAQGDVIGCIASVATVNNCFVWCAGEQLVPKGGDDSSTTGVVFGGECVMP